jgi:hypothetical protein
MALPSGEIFGNVDFWIKLVVAVLSFYVAKTVKRFEKDIRKNRDATENLAKEGIKHIGWHEGRGDFK